VIANVYKKNIPINNIYQIVIGGDNHIFDKPMEERLWATGEEMAQGYLITIEWE